MEAPQQILEAPQQILEAPQEILRTLLRVPTLGSVGSYATHQSCSNKRRSEDKTTAPFRYTVLTTRLKPSLSTRAVSTP